MQRRRETLKIEDPEHMTIAQLKATLRAANVSEHDIGLCIERSQLNTLYKERLDTEFKACVAVQRHWRRVLDYRRVSVPAAHASCSVRAREPAGGEAARRCGARGAQARGGVGVTMFRMPCVLTMPVASARRRSR